MIISDLILALKTVRPYYDDPSKNNISAKADKIFLDVPDRLMNESDIALMIDLGCVQPENKHLTVPKDYDPEDYWLIYP